MRERKRDREREGKREAEHRETQSVCQSPSYFFRLGLYVGSRSSSWTCRYSRVESHRVYGIERVKCVESRRVEGAEKGWSALSGRFGGCFVGLSLLGKLVVSFRAPIYHLCLSTILLHYARSRTCLVTHRRPNLAVFPLPFFLLSFPLNFLCIHRRLNLVNLRSRF